MVTTRSRSHAQIHNVTTRRGVLHAGAKSKVHHETSGGLTRSDFKPVKDKKGKVRWVYAKKSEVAKKKFKSAVGTIRGPGGQRVTMPIRDIFARYRLENPGRDSKGRFTRPRGA